MGRRLTGSLMFLGAATFLFEVAGRLASDQRGGWGWFLLTGLMMAGIALNIWDGESPDPRSKGPAPRDGWDRE